MPRCGIYCHLKTSQGYGIRHGTTPSRRKRNALEKRPRTRFESDLTDEEWVLVELCLPPPQNQLAGCGQCNPVHAPHRMPVAGDSSLFSGICDGSKHFYEWSREGVFDQLTDTFRARGRELLSDQKIWDASRARTSTQFNRSSDMWRTITQGLSGNGAR